MREETEKTGMRKDSQKWFIILHILILVLSTCGILAKLAAGEALFSLKFVLFYGCEIIVLGIYALLWQQVIKHIPLTVAFCNKAVGMIWSMLWGIILFKESVTASMIIGAVIVLAGVLLVVRSDA